MVSFGYHVAVLSDVLVEFHYIFISCFCFWSKPATPHKCFIVCSVSGMELFFYLFVVTFHAEQGRCHYYDVCALAYACVYVFYNKLCVLLLLFSPDPTSAIFLHHCFHEFPIDIVWNIGRWNILYPWWTQHVHSDHLWCCVSIRMHCFTPFITLLTSDCSLRIWCQYAHMHIFAHVNSIL
jgi:hypothetical protein